MKYLRKLIEPNELKQQFCLSKEMLYDKQVRDWEIANILKGISKKKLLIVGPCSADNESAVLEYVSYLAKIQERIKEKFLIIPRVYTAKPRTKGCGYMGLLHQPDINEHENIVKGIQAVRKIHFNVIKETGLSTADELLYPDIYEYLSDLISYYTIGARSVENQQHRLVASGIEVPVGLKNPTSGDLSVMLNGIKASQMPHLIFYKGWEVATDGNPLTHAILRGFSLNGKVKQNCSYDDILNLYDMYVDKEYMNPAVIIDASHSNCFKIYSKQIEVCNNIINFCKLNEKVNSLVKGIMIESYLEEGNQSIEDWQYGKSITDPCLGWKDTENLILTIAEKL